METGDDWFALDKLYHVLFCFSIAIFFAFLATRTRYPFLRRWSIWFGSLVSLAAGAAKEAGDEIGLWKSAGASTKDAISDLFGILIACFAFSLCNSFSSRKKLDEMEFAVPSPRYIRLWGMLLHLIADTDQNMQLCLFTLIQMTLLKMRTLL
ncbi:hypothetical protein HHK36_013841 [Tetracentron sinense]|uniref:Transmembrane protein n=1 Tax=Tetracentron sinense TaxID=13715 RepID=A0A834Z6Z6_TETSI|nr:hypothetical protein HHK36_013841 [Tetracentron sinense]